MNAEKFTQKAQVGIQAAREISIRFGHQEVDVEHLLMALLRQEDGLVPQVVAKVGASVADLLARGILGVIYQRLDGVEKLKLYYKTAFANPNSAAADQMRMTIRSNNINLATYMEQQETLMKKGLPMFRD